MRYRWHLLRLQAGITRFKGVIEFVRFVASILKMRFTFYLIAQNIHPNRHNDSILKAHWLTRSPGHGAPGNELRNMGGNSALENSWCHTIFWLPTDIVNLSKGFKYKIKLKALFLFSLWHILWVMIAKMKHCSFWTLSW